MCICIMMVTSESTGVHCFVRISGHYLDLALERVSSGFQGIPPETLAQRRVGGVGHAPVSSLESVFSRGLKNGQT